MPKKINLLIVNHSMGMGGIERMILDFVCTLPDDLYNISVAVFQSGGCLEKNLENAGVKIFHMDKQEGIDKGLFFRLARLIRQESIDVVHTNNYSAWFYAAVASKLLTRRRHIHTEHSNIGRGGKHRFLLEKMLCKLTDVTVAVSEKVKKVMVEGAKLSEDEVCVIANGIDIETFRSSSEVRKINRELLHIVDDDVVIIGTVGRLVSVKDHLMLIKAFSKVNNKIENSKLVIVGDGPLEVELKALVNKLELDGKVLLLGVRQDIDKLLNTFDIYAVSSLSEGMSLSILEAMSTSCPVVATNVGGNPELVKNLDTGLLTKSADSDAMADKLLELIHDPDLRIKMGLNARRLIEKEFSSRVMVENYCRIYESSKMGN